MLKNQVLIAPSILSANFSQIKDGIKTIEQAKADWVHVDVMDGSFVPDITFGHKMVKDIRPLTGLPLDVHLMVNHPETFIESFAKAGADYITIHAEATIHLHRVLSHIKECGVKAGISLVPSTPLDAIKELYSLVDLVLIMTVNPGFGGQSLILDCLNKIRDLKEIKNKKGYNFYIEIDGGINTDTYHAAVEAGSEVLVTGSAFFNAPQPENYIKTLKGEK
jgi:ribulose-phosphate 3-epimerase